MGCCFGGGKGVVKIFTKQMWYAWPSGRAEAGADGVVGGCGAHLE